MAEFDHDIQDIFINIVEKQKQLMQIALNENNIPLSPIYFIALKNIFFNKNSTANSIAQSLHRDKAQVTRMLNKLEMLNLISRADNIQDKRSQIIQLTALGKKHFKTLSNVDQEASLAMLTNLNPDQISVFITLGKKMAQNLNQYTES